MSPSLPLLSVGIRSKVSTIVQNRGFRGASLDMASIRYAEQPVEVVVLPFGLVRMHVARFREILDGLPVGLLLLVGPPGAKPRHGENKQRSPGRPEMQRRQPMQQAGDGEHGQ